MAILKGRNIEDSKKGFVKGGEEFVLQLCVKITGEIVVMIMKSLLSPLVVLAFILISLPQFVIAAPWTPAEWQDDGRLRNWVRDQNSNFVDDLIDKMVDGEVAVIVDLNNCIEIETEKGGEHELIRFLNSIGSVVRVGKYISYIVVDKVPVDQVSEIAARPEVAMVELALNPIPTGVARRALNVEATSEHDNLEAGFDGYKWPDDVDGRGIRIAIVDMGIDDNHSELAGKNPEGWGADCTIDPHDCSFENPQEYGEHGTSMARYALGTGNLGIAPGAEFIDIAVSRDIPGWRMPGSHLNALQLLYEMKINNDQWNIDIANLSFALGLEEASEENGLDSVVNAVNLLESRGIVVVAGGGLNGNELDAEDNPVCVEETNYCHFITAPGSAPRAITVVEADHNNSDRRNDDDVVRAARGAEWVPQPDDDDHYSDDLKPELATPTQDGNSVATAQTSGLVALILQHVPDINPGSVKDLLVRTAEKKVDDDDVDTDIAYPQETPSWNQRWGFGETDGYRILADRENSSLLTDVTFGSFIGATDDPPPRYDSPAITTERLEQGEPIKSLEPDTIKVRIRNIGENDAERVKVNFGWYPFTAGIPSFQHIGSMVVDLDAGERRILEYPWTPPKFDYFGNQHGCLLVTIDYGYDSNYTNRSNIAQKNISVVYSLSPAEFTFRVENTLPVDATIRLVPLEKHDNWTLKLSETELEMRPEDCARTVHATVEPSDDVKPGEEAVFHITSVAIPKDGSGNKREIGGVTLKAIKKAGEGPGLLPLGYLISFAALLLVFVPIGYVLWKKK